MNEIVFAFYNIFIYNTHYLIIFFVVFLFLRLRSWFDLWLNKQVNKWPHQMHFFKLQKKYYIHYKRNITFWNLSADFDICWFSNSFAAASWRSLVGANPVREILYDDSAIQYVSICHMSKIARLLCRTFWGVWLLLWIISNFRKAKIFRVSINRPICKWWWLKGSSWLD